MYIYSYTAITSNDSLVQDTLMAKSKKKAFLSIIENNQIPLKIRFKAVFTLNKLNLSYRVHFFHQLSALISSGINLLQCLKILNSNCHLPFWRNIFSCSIQALNRGESFSHHLKTHPKIFNNTVISLIIIAEKTGQYEENFRIITTMLEHNQQTSLLIKKALRYPITLVVFSLILLIIMLLYIVPQFEAIYGSFQHELPLLTKILMSISNTIREKSIYIIIAMSVIILCIINLNRSKPLYLYKLFNLIPPLRQLILLHNLNIFFLTISSTFKAGLSLSECLECSIETIVNSQYNKDCRYIHNSVIKGESLSVAMSQTQFIPSLAIQLISIAEESGKLHYFTLYLFNYYSQQYTSITEQKLKTLEPILLVFVATLIGVIMLAMYLPIFNLGNVITGM